MPPLTQILVRSSCGPEPDGDSCGGMTNLEKWAVNAFRARLLLIEFAKLSAVFSRRDRRMIWATTVSIWLQIVNSHRHDTTFDFSFAPLDKDNANCETATTRLRFSSGEAVWPARVMIELSSERRDAKVSSGDVFHFGSRGIAGKRFSGNCGK